MNWKEELNEAERELDRLENACAKCGREATHFNETMNMALCDECEPDPTLRFE